jgi:hypothetical protein
VNALYLFAMLGLNMGVIGNMRAQQTVGVTESTLLLREKVTAIRLSQIDAGVETGSLVSGRSANLLKS